MINNYEDIPTTLIGDIRHITKSGTKCLCGEKWEYGITNREGKSSNITWRKLESINCELCKEIYKKTGI